MNTYQVVGQITRLTNVFLKRLKFRNIESISQGYSNEIHIHMKEGPSAGIRFLEPGVKGVYWSVEDFEGRAKDLEGENWEKVYDKEMFEEALDLMIDKHDATLGISWDTIDFWLYEICKKE